MADRMVESQRPQQSGAGANPSDTELVERAVSGDREAFEALLARHARSVHGVLMASAPAQEVPDLVQDVCVAALDGLARLADPKAVGPWLCTIARNRAKDRWKAKRTTMEVELEPQMEPSRAAVPGLDDREEAARVMDCLQELPETYRETLALRLVEGLSGTEIAEATGLTHGSVRVNLCRGMKLFRERLAELGLQGGTR